jgi:hypothetical protein
MTGPRSPLRRASGFQAFRIYAHGVTGQDAFDILYETAISFSSAYKEPLFSRKLCTDVHGLNASRCSWRCRRESQLSIDAFSTWIEALNRIKYPPRDWTSLRARRCIIAYRTNLLCCVRLAMHQGEFPCLTDAPRQNKLHPHFSQRATVHRDTKVSGSIS